MESVEGVEKMSGKVGSSVVHSNVIYIQQMTIEQVKVAMEKIGGIVEGHAKELCPVDTGLLKNSICHGLGGQSIGYKYQADRPDKNGEIKKGEVSGQFPADEDKNKITVYIGTNVEYAQPVELGHVQEPGRYVPALGKRLKAAFVAGKPFLRPAATNYMAEIAQALQVTLKTP